MTLLLGLASVTLASVGQLFLKLGTGRLSLHLLVGLFLYGVSTLAWLSLLRTVPLSRAYPLLALNFILVPLLSRIFLGEELGRDYLAGTVFLLLGLALIWGGGR